MSPTAIAMMAISLIVVIGGFTVALIRLQLTSKRQEEDDRP